MLSILAALSLIQAQPDCAAPAPLPPELAGWTGEPAGRLRPGRVSNFSTVPDAADPAGGAQVARLVVIPAAGRYAIALDEPGRIALRTATGDLVEPAGRRAGPACSGIVQIVSYDLAAGAHHLEVGGLRQPRTRVMLVSEGASR